MMSSSVDASVSSLESFLSQLSLANTSERASILENIAPIVSEIGSRQEWRQRLQEADLGMIFDCFNAEGEKEVEAAAEILTKVNEFLDQGVVINKYVLHLSGSD